MSAPPVPRCYDTGLDWQTERAHALLEDPSATHHVPAPPHDGLGRGTWEQVVDAYAEIHDRWWDHPTLNDLNLVRVPGVGVAHEAVSPEAIRESERYFAQVALPARVAQLGEALLSSVGNERVPRLEL